MRESRLMLIQYATAIAALVLVTIHLLMQGVLFNYYIAIDYQHVLSVYRNWVDWSLLEVLLVVVVSHGFNGLRVILLEWRQGASWTRGVNWAILIVTLLVIAYGTRTAILAATGVAS